MRARLRALPVVTVLVCWSPGARADDAMGFELAAKAGMITSPVDFGLGARAGASVAHFYFGLDVDYYFPKTTSSSPPGDSGLGSAYGSGTTASSSSTTSFLFYGAQLGYDIRLVPALTLRPVVGLGWNRESTTCSTSSGAGYSCAGVSETDLYAEPGVQALYALGTRAFVGVDANYLMVFGSGSSGRAFSAHGEVGVTF
jgi:Autotransporter beta-domain